MPVLGSLDVVASIGEQGATFPASVAQRAGRGRDSAPALAG
jgi:hypothetical protein